jgi:hypothetical protein
MVHLGDSHACVRGRVASCVHCGWWHIYAGHGDRLRVSIKASHAALVWGWGLVAGMPRVGSPPCGAAAGRCCCHAWRFNTTRTAAMVPALVTASFTAAGWRSAGVRLVHLHGLPYVPGLPRSDECALWWSGFQWCGRGGSANSTCSAHTT